MGHGITLNQQHPIFDELVGEQGGNPLDSPGLFSWAWGGDETFADFEARAKAKAAALDAPAPTAREVAKKR